MPGKLEQERENDNNSPRSHEDSRRHDDVGRPREIGGPKGPEPTRYGDWQRAGRCIDF
jgi:hypothetical protein